MKNISINAGFAAARLRERAEGLSIMAIVGYTPIPDDEDGIGRCVAHWRSGIVKQFQPDIMAKEIVFQFHWEDDEGVAEIGIFEDEEIILILPEASQHLLERFA